MIKRNHSLFKKATTRLINFFISSFMMNIAVQSTIQNCKSLIYNNLIYFVLRINPNYGLCFIIGTICK